VKEIIDKLGRGLRDLRISVTDRCNFRCRYCMPAEVFGAGYEFLPKQEILSFDEIESVAQLLISLGVKKLRITGGEPLLRRDLEVLVEKLAVLDGVEDLAMTTNGVLLPKHAAALKKAGLQRVTVSLDAIDEEIFGKMNGVGAKANKVIDGIRSSIDAGLSVKINSVLKKGVNEGEVMPLLQLARDFAVPIRFIEYMDTGNTNQWQLHQVVSSADLLVMLQEKMPLQALAPSQQGETATRYAIPGIEGFEVGLISSVSQPFCSQCNRMRLSADGKLFACLFASSGLDIKAALRSGRWHELREEVTQFWSARTDRYSMQRAMGLSQDKQEMSYMGG
jgi:GTP 3',8-cyclase